MQALRANSSRSHHEEKKSSSAESADLFSDEEPQDRPAFTFGGKKIAVTKTKRRSTSWPEVEVAEFKRRYN